MTDVIAKEGQTGKGRLADTIGVEAVTIDRYMSGKFPIPADNAFHLARACGIPEGDALELMKGLRSTRRQRTA